MAIGAAAMLKEATIFLSFNAISTVKFFEKIEESLKSLGLEKLKSFVLFSDAGLVEGASQNE